jgi:hypothetical protein
LCHKGWSFESLFGERRRYRNRAAEVINGRNEKRETRMKGNETMKSRAIVAVMAAVMVFSGMAMAGSVPPPAPPPGPLTWTFTNPSSDYYVNNAALNLAPVGGNAYIAPQSVDDAAVFARVNTQAPGLKLSSVIGGGYTIDGFSAAVGTPENVYGSLYLSPTGGSGADVLILISPMSISGTAPGMQDYSFGLGTHADYRTRDISGNWTAFDPARSGTFGDIVGMLSSNPDYVAFFGPQIGESGTSGTTFDVSRIQLSTAVPEPVTMLGVLIGTGGIGVYLRRRQQVA